MYAHLSPYTQVEILTIAKMEAPGIYALEVSQRNQAPIPMNLNRDQIFNLAGNLINHSGMRMNFVAKNGNDDGNVIAITKNSENEKLRIHFMEDEEKCYEYKTFDEFIDDIISYVGDGHGTIQFVK
jgi:hypothetical protein